MPHAMMDETALASWILRRLGSPFIKVELDECHLTDAIDYARQWFAAKKGVKKQLLIKTTTGVSCYPLPDEADTVIDVSFQVSRFDLSMIFSPYIFLDEKVPYDVFAAPRSVGLYSTFVQSLQYIETAKRIMSADQDWEQNGRNLFLFPPPREDAAVLVDVKTTTVKIDQLNERDHNLVMRYALAQAKMDLGRIRSKYSEYPTAQGSISLDGATLLEEAQKEIEVLDEEIGLSGYPMMIFTG